jgi:hypothetical protein
VIGPERVQAIREFGYTPREAEFIATAALHSGYFLRRQVCAVRGKLADCLCRKALALGHATATVYARNTHIFHLHFKPLYTALGQENNRNRRQVEPGRVRGKLIGLDYVLLHRHDRFLPTEEDKIRYFVEQRGLSESVLPTTAYFSKDRSRTTRRHFVDKFPVRISGDGKVSFVYVDDGVFTSPGFPLWLSQYGALIRALSDAGVIYCATNPAAFKGCERLFGLQFPANGLAIGDELREYCELRGDIERNGLSGRPQAVLDRYRTLQRRFSEHRYEDVYAARKNAQKDANVGHKVTLETFVIPHSYALLGTVGASRQARSTGAAN